LTTDDRSWGQFTHFAKTSNGHNSATYQQSPSCLALGWGFWGRHIERCHFRLDQIQDGGGHLEKLQMAKSLKLIIRFTVCVYTDHTLPSVSNL